jgi:hypothetical protein
MMLVASPSAAPTATPKGRKPRPVRSAEKPEHVLQVERRDEELAEEDREEQQGHEVATDPGALLEEAQRQQRGGCDGLVGQEPQDGDGAPDERHHHLRGRPRLGRGLDEAEDDADEPARHEHRAGDVDGAGAAGGSVGVRPDQPRHEHEGGDRDRDVEQEDPAPRGELDQRARTGSARSCPRGRDAAEQADRLDPLAGVGEQQRDEPERRRRGERLAEALREARADQGSGVRREAAGHGRHPNTVTPTRNSRRRPNTSPSRPPSSSRPPAMST